jgi:hypothetical protein
VSDKETVQDDVRRKLVVAIDLRTPVFRHTKAPLEQSDAGAKDLRQHLGQRYWGIYNFARADALSRN